jgi:FtsH-binding integral membrane protein
MTSVFDNLGNIGHGIDIQALMKSNDITPGVQKHLIRVYWSLLLCVIASTIGIWLHMKFGYGGGWITLLGGLGLAMWIQNDPNKSEINRRLAILCGFGLLQGMYIGPLVNIVAHINPAIILTAFFGTTIIFGCFSMAAIVSKRRSYLYLGGILSSALTLMFFLGIANIFFGSEQIYNLQLYGGLIMFSGYVIFDTQLILEKAINGDGDFVGHAMSLFIDFIAIFVRLLIILAKNSEKKDKKNKR